MIDLPVIYGSEELQCDRTRAGPSFTIGRENICKGKIVRSTVFASLQATLLLGVALTMTALDIDSARAAEQDEIAAIKAFIHETAEVWNTQDFRKVLDLWDQDEEAPFYLAEEQERWFIGWEPLRAYLAPPLPNPVLEALREEMYDISVKLIADDLAIVVWYMHFEMKMRGRLPLGEEIRMSAVLRKKPEGWRYIHWAESPLTPGAYLDRLRQKEVDYEKFNPLLERGRAVREAWTAEAAEQAAGEGP